ncbi:hypothetical protein [Sphingomonas aquatilis]
MTPRTPITGEEVGHYQPLAWQIVTDELGYGSIHETDEDGKPGDLVADVFGDHANLLVSAPRLLKALTALLSIAGTPVTERQAEIFAEARSAATAARQQGEGK